MALVFDAKQSVNKVDAQWRNFNDKNGNVLASLLIRGNGYRPYQQAIDRISRYTLKIDEMMADGITADSLAVPEGGLSEMDAYYLIVAQHLIVDWRDVQDEEGNPIPYSVDVATKILEQNVDLWKWLLKQAGDIQQSANEQVEETVKKPLPVTAGSAKTRVRKKPKSPASG